jgi:hypothetical protein
MLFLLLSLIYYSHTHTPFQSNLYKQYLLSLSTFLFMSRLGFNVACVVVLVSNVKGVIHKLF